MISEKLNIEALVGSVEHITYRFVELVSSFNQENINTVPFQNSWTAAQVADHVTMSNESIIISLKLKGKNVSRSFDQAVPGLRDVFLNFEKKLQSPQFILPTRTTYERHSVLENLMHSIEELMEMAGKIDYAEAIDHPIFGEITKYELLYFVLFHTQRHFHQLKNIMQHVQGNRRTQTRKIILLIHTSLDGFVAGMNGETDWITIDDEIFKDSNDLAITADIALYGRTTFQMMESYWPTVLTNSNSTPAELEHAEWMEQVTKIVFSRTLEKVEWNNARLVKENVTGEVTALKQLPGGNMIILGSPCLAHSFTKRGLIDEFRINVNPVVLGQGTPLFENTVGRFHLNLINSKTFRSGVVGLHYEKNDIAY